MNFSATFLSSLFSLAVFTLEDEQIVWTDKSSQTNKSSGQMPDDLSVQTICSSSSVKTANENNGERKVAEKFTRYNFQLDILYQTFILRGWLS